MVEEVKIENGEVLYIVSWYKWVADGKVDYCFAKVTGKGSMADLFAVLIMKGWIGISSIDHSKFVINLTAF